MNATPVIREMKVYPVAGRDSMLLNLSGAHAPYFTRNVIILTDSTGHVGVGEVPGGQKITQTLEDAVPMVVGQSIAEYKNIEPIIVVSKSDLGKTEDFEKIYRLAGFSVFTVNNLTGEGTMQVKALLEGKISAFCGNSGRFQNRPH